MGHDQHSPRWICDDLMNVDKGLVRDELSFEPDPWKSIQVEIFVRAAMMGDQTYLQDNREIGLLDVINLKCRHHSSFGICLAKYAQDTEVCLLDCL